MLEYDGRWSPDLFSVALTAAAEQELKEIQMARLVIGSSLASLFSKDVNPKINRMLARTTTKVRQMKFASRGLEWSDDDEIGEEDLASQFVRVFQKMGVVAK